ncbi:HAD family hydrolase [Ideonella paludis]|uniref:HAD-IA family hydrolase n=1 Tax=Ideonella paludis TaxID=1233411 RepID=A0ABS5E1X4_9BURK|nr:HAD-IA family hydrolase [Ideonella paludis]MBQ0937396.1 HAD-IA family hydrolase [Ideonella paludis]
MRSHLLFDLDGTLSDPSLGIARCINQGLQALGYEARPEASLHRYIGPPLDQTFKALTSRDDAAHLAELVAAYRERYAQRGYAENTLYPGVPEALQALRQAGAVLGLVTSKRVDFAEQILDLFGLRHHFAWVSGGEIGTPKWQQLQALCASGQVAEHAIMIGDRDVDLQAAHRNGLRSAAVYWGFGSAEELQAEQPHHHCHAPADWLKLWPWPTHGL